MTKNIKSYKAKDIGEIAYLMFKNIELVDCITYEKKSILYFKNDNKQSEKAIMEYYNSEYYDYYKSMQKARQFLFNRNSG